jgi:sulfur transfer protein SufE
MKRSLALTVGVLFLLLPPALQAQKKSKLDLSLRYLLLATKKTSTMQKEMREAAAAGYRILVGSPTSGTEMALTLEKVAEPPDTYEYLLLATTKTSTMQKELREAAAQGFRLLPSTLIQKKQMFGRVEIVMILERAPGGETRYQYLLLATTRTSTLQKEMREATEQGYEVVGMVSRGEHIVILEKAEAQ